MSRLLRLTSLSILTFGLLQAGNALADPTGLWDTEDKEGRVQISPCGDKLCGDLVWIADALDAEGQPKRDEKNPDESLRERPLEGLRILWDMQPSGDGKTWQDGRVYDPESGKTYQGRITLEGDNVLKLRGFVGTPMFGRTSTWTRAK